MSGLKKVLIIDEVHEILVHGLQTSGYDVDYQPTWQRGDLISHIAQYEGLVVRTKTEIDKDVLLHAEKLKFIGRAGAGVDNIDTDWCDRKGIVYFNSGEANADAVGEQTIGMLLSMMANMVKADDEVKAGIWDREGNRGEELKGKTVGIIGYGNTGKAVAKKLAGFEVNVLAYDKYLHNYGDHLVAQAGMEQIFNDADILTLHVPLTRETHLMVNAAYLAQFAKPIYLLNLSRGKVVDLVSVCDALDNGKLKSVALDVLENEKLSTLNAAEQVWFKRLKTSPKVILTPHIGGWTRESYRKISAVLLQKIKELT